VDSAQLIVFDCELPILPGSKFSFHQQQTEQPCKVLKLVSTLDRATGQVLKRSPRCVTRNSSAVVEVQLDEAVCAEPFRDCRDLGRLLLRAGGKTVAAGIILEILN
jgi:elongation factor 1 alpha-like protein